MKTTKSVWTQISHLNPPFPCLCVQYVLCGILGVSTNQKAEEDDKVGRKSALHRDIEIITFLLLGLFHTIAEYFPVLLISGDGAEGGRRGGGDQSEGRSWQVLTHQGGPPSSAVVQWGISR